jgi:CheY-like chemotaxis protein
MNYSVQGTGLGMPISHKYCTLMGGSLSVESVYGEGSTFKITIPYVPSDPVEYDGAGDEIISLPNLRVLVVDDIEINVQIAAEMMEAFDIHADTALSGAEAIKMATKTDYDLIFMDHMMPEMDGIETTAHLRALGGKFETLPIIALTANAANNAEQLFLRSGFSGFLSKPLEFATLARCIRSVGER